MELPVSIQLPDDIIWAMQVSIGIVDTDPCPERWRAAAWAQQRQSGIGPDETAAVSKIRRGEDHRYRPAARDVEQLTAND